MNKERSTWIDYISVREASSKCEFPKIVYKYLFRWTDWRCAAFGRCWIFPKGRKSKRPAREESPTIDTAQPDGNEELFWQSRTVAGGRNMENCSHARRFLLYSDVVVILKSTVGLAGCTGTPVMQRNDFQSSSSFDKNRESRSENSMSLQIGIIPERILKGEMGTIHYRCYLPVFIQKPR